MFLSILLACTAPDKQNELPLSPVGLLDFYAMLDADAPLFGYDNGEWTED